MIRLLLRQPLNIWRSLGSLNKIEIILLLGLVYSYLVGRIYHLFTGFLEHDWLTPFDLSGLTTHLFILSMFLSGPFILLYLVPRQATLIPFFTQPLAKKHYFHLTGYLYFKYQLITLLLAIPFISALVGINWFAVLLSFISLGSYGLIVFFIQNVLFVRNTTRLKYAGVQLLILVAFYTVYGLQFVFIKYPVIFDFAVLIGAAFFLTRYYNRMPDPELEHIFPPDATWMKKSKIGKISFSNIPNFLPGNIRLLFKKELVGLWRNPAYRRLKIITLFVYLLFLLLIAFAQIGHKDIWMTVFTIAVIWIHFSNHFNEKYVQPEPEWFFKTVPIRFHQVWISKFLTEFFYIAVILCLFWIVQIGIGLSLPEQLNLLGLVLIFSVLVLAVMLNFQIMFYEDPRLAGYAYHFTILFLVIMSLNYKLVGPLIGIVLLTFYFYKSYKYFRT